MPRFNDSSPVRPRATDSVPASPVQISIFLSTWRDGEGWAMVDKQSTNGCWRWEHHSWQPNVLLPPPPTPHPRERVYLGTQKLTVTSSFSIRRWTRDSRAPALTHEREDEGGKGQNNTQDYELEAREVFVCLFFPVGVNK